jgi:hypothetical protein
MSLSKDIWQTLTAVDVSDHIEKKGNLAYLSWAWAYGTMMEHYPELHYTFEQDRCEFTNTVEISCSVLVNVNDQSMVRSMWLPVMDHRNKAIANPDKFAINSSKMRCLVKCFAMFGLGHHIYAGEDINPVVVKAAINNVIDKAAINNVIDDAQLSTLTDLLDSTGADVRRFCEHYEIASTKDLMAAQFDQAIAKLEAKASR